jgi:hypothetical protein
MRLILNWNRLVQRQCERRAIKKASSRIILTIEIKKNNFPINHGAHGEHGGENHLMAGKLKSYDLLTTSYFPVRSVFPVVFFFLKAIPQKCPAFTGSGKERGKN